MTGGGWNFGAVAWLETLGLKGALSKRGRWQM